MKGNKKDGPCKVDVPWVRPTDGRKHPRHFAGITRLLKPYNRSFRDVKEKLKELKSQFATSSRWAFDVRGLPSNSADGGDCD
jgi:hypothetical protein